MYRTSRSAIPRSPPVSQVPAAPSHGYRDRSYYPDTECHCSTHCPANRCSHRLDRPNLVASTTTKDIVDIGTSNPETGIVSVNSQFTTRAGKRIPQSQKLAAAADYKAIREAYLLQGNLTAQTPGGYQTAGYSIAAVPPTMDPGGIPHYFGPFPNYANSPMPMGNISSITVTEGGTGYAAPVVTITDAYFTGSGATATAAVSLGAITNITITNPGTNYTAPVVIITDATVGSSGAEATATLGGPFISGIRKFVDTLPGLNVDRSKQPRELYSCRYTGQDNISGFRLL